MALTASGREERRRRFDLEALAAQLGGVTPSPVLRGALGASLAGRSLALCLHRVAASPRQSAPRPELCIAPDTLDAVVELLLAARPGATARWLTVSFDDGYEDAVQYVNSRARRFGDVEFLVFVCPEKLERRAGFRWDLIEESVKRGAPLAEARARAEAPFDLDAENCRPELLALGDAPDYRLASVEAVRELAALPNVGLGNHTNLHAAATSMSLEAVREDYRRSTAQFTRLLGAAPRHFAFPFGAPGHQFDSRHVEALRALGDFLIWTTEASPHAPAARRPGAVLPRMPLDGRRSARALVGGIAARALTSLLRGPRAPLSPAPPARGSARPRSAPGR